MPELLNPDAQVIVGVADLKAAFLKWNELVAKGETLSPEEAAELSPDELAEDQAITIHNLLTSEA